MTLYRNKYRVESARLSGWNYASSGYYFITVCTVNRSCLFGHIDNGIMLLNDFGTIVQNEWVRSFEIRKELIPIEFVVMPNHLHGVVQLINVNEIAITNYHVEFHSPMLNKSISSFIRGVKSTITKQINTQRNTPGKPVFQKRFHDHVIRNDLELARICKYIINNPSNWYLDKMRLDNSNRLNEPSVAYGDEPWMV